MTQPSGYTGPTWHTVTGALDLIEDKFGGGFYVQMMSAYGLGTHKERGLVVRVVWRRWLDFKPVEFRAKTDVYKASTHGSVPALIMILIRRLWEQLQTEGFEKQPSAPKHDEEDEHANC